METFSFTLLIKGIMSLGLQSSFKLLSMRYFQLVKFFLKVLLQSGFSIKLNYKLGRRNWYIQCFFFLKTSLHYGQWPWHCSYTHWYIYILYVIEIVNETLQTHETMKKQIHIHFSLYMYNILSYIYICH